MTTGNLTIQDNDTVVQYALTGLYVFSTTFPILETNELKVSIDQALLTYGTHYTIAGLGDEGGVEITLTAAGETLADAGDLITLWQDMPIERLTGFSAGAAVLLPEALNSDFARSARVEQQLRREIRNSVRLQPDDPVGGQDMVLPALLARAGRYMAFDADGKPVPATGTGNDAALRTDLAITTAAAEGGLLVGFRQGGAGAIARTMQAKLKEFITVTDFGAVGDDVTDDAPAIQAAIDYAQSVGGELYFPRPSIAYRINTQLELTPELPVTLRGCGAGWTSSLLPNDVGGGACLRLDAAAGAGAAILKCAGFIMGLYIRGLHFYCREVGLDHRGIVLQEALQTEISGCRFQGGSNALDDQYGIELLDPTDFGGTYTGSVNISGNYFSTLRYGVWCSPNCTTVRITHNEFSGFTGSVNAVRCEADTVGVKILHNMMQGWDVGFLDEGSTNDFSHNYLEANDVNQDRSAASLPMSAFNSIVSGGSPVLPTDRTKATINISPRNFLVDDTVAQFGLGYRERYRTFAMGFYQTYAPTFSANNSMTFTSVATSTVAGDTTAIRYTVIGNTVTIDFMFQGTVGGTPSTELRFTLQSDFDTPSGRVRVPCVVFNNGAFAAGFVEIRSGEAFARVSLLTGGSFTAGAAGADGRVSFLTND